MAAARSRPRLYDGPRHRARQWRRAVLARDGILEAAKVGSGDRRSGALSPLPLTLTHVHSQTSSTRHVVSSSRNFRRSSPSLRPRSCSSSVPSSRPLIRSRSNPLPPGPASSSQQPRFLLGLVLQVDAAGLRGTLPQRLILWLPADVLCSSDTTRTRLSSPSAFNSSSPISSKSTRARTSRIRRASSSAGSSSSPSYGSSPMDASNESLESRRRSFARSPPPSSSSTQFAKSSRTPLRWRPLSSSLCSKLRRRCCSTARR